MGGLEGTGDGQGAVLIVEDEVLVRLLIADALRQSGFMVIEAANGYEARTVLQSSNPVAVLITDVKMPGIMDGLTLAKWIRAQNPAVKIILVSGSMPPGAQSLADAVFIKPYAVEALVKRVSELMRNGGVPPAVECA